MGFGPKCNRISARSRASWVVARSEWWFWQVRIRRTIAWAIYETRPLSLLKEHALWSCQVAKSLLALLECHLLLLWVETRMAIQVSLFVLELSAKRLWLLQVVMNLGIQSRWHRGHSKKLKVHGWASLVICLNLRGPPQQSGCCFWSALSFVLVVTSIESNCENN